MKRALEGVKFTVTELGEDVRARNKKFFDARVEEEQAAKKQRLDAFSSLQFAAQLKDVVRPDLLAKLVDIAVTRKEEAQKLVERGEAVAARRTRERSTASGKAGPSKGGSGDASSESEV